MGIKRKNFPGNTADIPALESWLEDLALEGLFPLSFNGYYAKFREGRPQKTTYRIEVPKYFEATPPKAMVETYKEFGWQFVCHMWEYYLFASTEECPIEPHTDPLVQAELLEESHRDSMRMFLSCFGVIAVFMVLFLLITWSELDTFLRGFSLLECLTMVLAYAIGIGWTAWELRTKSRLRRRLAAGIPMEHRKSYRKALFTRPVQILCMVLIASIPLLSTLIGFWERPREYAVSELPASLPYLTIAEAEGTEGKSPATVMFADSLFAPVQYTIQESGEYSFLETTYLQIRPGLFAPQAMKTLSDAGEYSWQDFLERQEIDVPPGLLDGIEYYHTGNRTVFAARKGSAIIKVKYKGSADIAAQLPAYAALLEQRYDAPMKGGTP